MTNNSGTNLLGNATISVARAAQELLNNIDAIEELSPRSARIIRERLDEPVREWVEVMEAYLQSHRAPTLRDAHAAREYEGGVTLPDRFEGLLPDTEATEPEEPDDLRAWRLVLAALRAEHGESEGICYHITRAVREVVGPLGIAQRRSLGDRMQVQLAAFKPAGVYDFWWPVHAISPRINVVERIIDGLVAERSAESRADSTSPAASELRAWRTVRTWLREEQERHENRGNWLTLGICVLLTHALNNEFGLENADSEDATRLKDRMQARLATKKPTECGVYWWPRTDFATRLTVVQEFIDQLESTDA